MTNILLIDRILKEVTTTSGDNTLVTVLDGGYFTGGSCDAGPCRKARKPLVQQGTKICVGFVRVDLCLG
jgi:hypothetical protein